MQKHGTLKDTQSILRHASIQTTGDVYVQRIDQSVIETMNLRTSAVLEDWKAPVEELRLKGRNLRGLDVTRRNSAKPEDEVAVSA
jgi:hypothetical protein